MTTKNKYLIAENQLDIFLSKLKIKKIKIEYKRSAVGQYMIMKKSKPKVLSIIVLANNKKLKKELIKLVDEHKNKVGVQLIFIEPEYFMLYPVTTIEQIENIINGDYKQENDGLTNINFILNVDSKYFDSIKDHMENKDFFTYTHENKNF